MALEQTKNLGVTKLDGAINNSVTSLTVKQGGAFPSSGNFRILIGSEIMLVTARSGNTLTVTRAQETTSAASHSDLDLVSGVLTSAAIDQMLADRNKSDTYANLPSASTNGLMYFPTDSPYVLRDNGSSFQHMAGLYQFVQPDLTQFTWLNQGTASTDTTKGGITVTVPNVGGQNLRVLHKSKTAPYKVSAYFNLNARNYSFESCGLGFYDPTGGRLATIHLINFTSVDSYAEVCYWNSATSFSSAPANMMLSCMGTTLNWLQVEHDGTNLSFRVGNDGNTWITLATLGKTAFLTTAPTKVLFYGRNDTGVANHTFDLLSWREQ